MGSLRPARSSKRIEIAVDGMTCAACSAAVETHGKKTRRRFGSIRKFNDQPCKLRIRPGKGQAFRDQGRDRGCGIFPAGDRTGGCARHRERTARARELRIMRIRLIVSIVFAAPILYIAMGHMFGLGLPVPRFMDHQAHPLAFALVQFS